ncbi:MAG: phosphate ABC transporter, permease protein PstA, partial [Thermoleophilaceae bacterium]
MSATALRPVGARRRRTDKIARGLLLAATLVALVPLVLVLYYLIKKGIGTWSWHFFSTDSSGRFFGDPGGIKSAIVGTVLIVA